MEHQHAIDCPGGELCFCGVLPPVVVRQVLPRPKRVEVLPHAPAQQAPQKLANAANGTVRYPI